MSIHNFVDWPGFFKQERYCKDCGAWESEAHVFRCVPESKAKVVRNSVSELEADIQAASERKLQTYVFGGLNVYVDTDNYSYNPWNQHMSLSPEDDVTELRFADGDTYTPKQIKEGGRTHSLLGQEFTFRKVRQDWADKGIESESTTFVGNWYVTRASVLPLSSTAKQLLLSNLLEQIWGDKIDSALTEPNPWSDFTEEKAED